LTNVQIWDIDGSIASPQILNSDEVGNAEILKQSEVFEEAKKLLIEQFNNKDIIIIPTGRKASLLGSFTRKQLSFIKGGFKAIYYPKDNTYDVYIPTKMKWFEGLVKRYKDDPTISSINFYDDDINICKETKNRFGTIQKIKIFQIKTENQKWEKILF
jgi:hypothetical protein